jgi:hydroxymethylglutaryl-CoA reductase (NADPH)
MATTEGALIASTTRGCKAISMSGGATAVLVGDGMSRAPVIQVRDVAEAKQVQDFCEENFNMFAEMFNSTSRYARLKSIKCTIAGRKVYLRFTASSGDAMGMNMVGKGVEQALKVITDKFQDSFVLALSGNMCTDKKPSSINWTEGRGKSVAVDCVIKGEVVKQVLKTSVQAIVDTNIAKNLMGSALAGSIGGFNAHAANNVTAMFLATGQDPAQNVESSNCMTIMEPINGGEDLYVAVTMPSIEVGTIGGGTALPGQHSMLNLLGVAGSDPENPGANAELFAKQVASGVMAGELSLTAALSSGHLISSHMKLNRKSGQ